MKCVRCDETDLMLCANCAYKMYCSDFGLTQEEAKALVKEFGTSYINANENHLAALVMQRMIGFVNELAKDNS